MASRTVLERHVKRMIKNYLDSLPYCYWRMPVPYGWGKVSLDFEGCLFGQYFAIEAKSPDEGADLTPIQRDTCISICNAGGKVFIISGEEGMSAFDRWVRNCHKGGHV